MTPKEVEIKLEVAPASLTRLEQIPLISACKAPSKRTQEVSVYFDTDKQTLRKAGLTLRVRRIGDRYIQTIKTTANASLFERDEWESEIEGDAPDLRLARDTALAPLLGRKFRRQLIKPMFETRVQRTVYPLADEKRAIALTVDQGDISAGGRSVPLCEIELELERGNATELFDVAREITQALPAQLALKSKSQRGYELLDGKPPAPIKMVAVDLAAGMRTRDGFAAIGRAGLRHIIANEPALLRNDPEGVHQMRVGLRRLRAAMALFADLLQDAQTAAIKGELKWLTQELAPARELEVLIKRVVAPVKKRHVSLDGIPGLSRELSEKRAAALERARSAVASARFRALTLEIAAWLETGHWTSPQDDHVRAQGDAPIEASATAELKRRWKKIRKKGKVLARLDAKRRHRLRIQAKKVRYATEFFAPLFSGKRAPKRRKKFLNALERLQDTLGDLNDIVVHEDLITAMRRGRRQSSPKRAFAAGLLTGREDARLDAALAAAVDACGGAAKVKPFWR
jgi:inorganic triphosphatase YgiF